MGYLEVEWRVIVTLLFTITWPIAPAKVNAYVIVDILNGGGQSKAGEGSIA